MNGTGGPKRPTGRTKALVLARYLKGQNQAQIARGLGISDPTVSQHIAELRAAGALSEPASPPQEQAS